jgi:hypothetical protein
MVDGFFSKIIYSTADFVMNGLYLQLPFHIEDQKLNAHFRTAISDSSLDNLAARAPHYNSFAPLFSEKRTKLFDISPKHIYTFDPRQHAKQIQQLCDVEQHILQQYKVLKSVDKLPIYSLRNQLFHGYIKMQMGSVETPTSRIVLKITGVWETMHGFGISFNFIST